MPSPFPGMNPYSENYQIWPQIHKRLDSQEIQTHYRILYHVRFYAKR